MSMSNDSAAEAIGAYFGGNVFIDEPTWSTVLLEKASEVYDSVDELLSALDLMNLRAETAPVPSTDDDV
ncbi:hypothetical protein [Nocardioides bruguierae]|uniref:Uncharacterized protein n=1 Tax=Nocardioides bruguierae TaxID=2945102 RepID=A0A9X2IF32_9ACTN|nr:hypothetical protein [Nocardioides bruguierae]MCL8026651.1 hypothetical protein [Nocardioides bruguierae]MCM0620917.1 hypothetical protein [Nocardioides bruguierae]